MASKLSGSSEGNVDTTPAAVSPLKLLMQAKVACANCIHDLETLDGLSDDWSEDEEYFTDAALDLHLHCEAAAKEYHDIVDTLDTFATAPTGTAFVQQFVEVECRQELALEEVHAISAILRRLKSGGVAGGTNVAPDGDIALAIPEMDKRCKRLMVRLEGVKQKIGRLQRLTERMLLPTTSQGQAQAEA